EETCERRGDQAIARRDLAHLLDALAIARREGIDGRRLQRRAFLYPPGAAESVHQPVQVPPVGEQVELDDRLAPPIRRSEPDLPGFRIGLVDAEQQRADLLADRVP